MPTLSHEQQETFLKRGFVHLPGAIPQDTVARWTKDTFARLGYDPNDKTTWAEARIHMPTHRSLEVRDVSPDAWSAISELLGGEARIKQPCTWGDGFIVNLGSDDDADTWQPPSPQAGGWHKDGDWFKHFLDSPEQGLLVIALWSDVRPKGGATFVACDSVAQVARFLAERPAGVRPGEFDVRGMIGRCHDFIEATGEAGDVYLLHPYMLHASSKNALRLPRLITNPAVSLLEPMQFNRQGGDCSLVEQAVLRGLEVERLEFHPTTPRERITPERVRRQEKMLEAERARLATARGE